MSDPTDPGGVGTAQAERVSRTTRFGDAGSPVGSPLTIILAVVAVVVGFLIFRTIDSDGGNALGEIPGAEVTVAGGTGTGPTTPGATAPSGTTGATTPGATSVVPSGRQTSGADVIVINASEVSGSAGNVSDLLKEAGYQMVEPAVSDSDDTQDAETIVYYNSGTGSAATEAVAQSVARDMGVTAVEALADSSTLALTTGDSVGSATVFVWLGTDKSASTVLAPQAPSAPAVNSSATTDG